MQPPLNAAAQALPAGAGRIAAASKPPPYDSEIRRGGTGPPPSPCTGHTCSTPREQCSLDRYARALTHLASASAGVTWSGRPLVKALKESSSLRLQKAVSDRQPQTATARRGVDISHSLGPQQPALWSTHPRRPPPPRPRTSSQAPAAVRYALGLCARSFRLPGHAPVCSSRSRPSVRRRRGERLRLRLRLRLRSSRSSRPDITETTTAPQQGRTGEARGAGCSGDGQNCSMLFDRQALVSED